MNKNINLKEEMKTCTDNIKDLENDLTTTKVKVYNLEYDVKNLQKEEFNSKDTIVIRNVSLPPDGYEEKHVKELLNYLEIEEIDTDEDVLAVERKGNSQDRLGSVFVKMVDENTKKEIMKKPCSS